MVPAAIWVTTDIITTETGRLRLDLGLDQHDAATRTGTPRRSRHVAWSTAMAAFSSVASPSWPKSCPRPRCASLRGAQRGPAGADFGGSSSRSTTEDRRPVVAVAELTERACSALPCRRVGARAAGQHRGDRHSSRLPIRTGRCCPSDPPLKGLENHFDCAGSEARARGRTRADPRTKTGLASSRLVTDLSPTSTGRRPGESAGKATATPPVRHPLLLHRERLRRQQDLAALSRAQVSTFLPRAGRPHCSRRVRGLARRSAGTPHLRSALAVPCTVTRVPGLSAPRPTLRVARRGRTAIPALV